MSDRSYPQDLPTVRLPDKFIAHWIVELIRLHDLTEVLYRSMRYAEQNEHPFSSGDSELVEHIKSSMSSLWAEIEEVRDGNWEPRSWEKAK